MNKQDAEFLEFMQGLRTEEPLEFTGTLIYGKYVDNNAKLYGLTREPGESDGSLVKRMLEKDREIKLRKAKENAVKKFREEIRDVITRGATNESQKEHLIWWVEDLLEYRKAHEGE